MRSLVYSGWVGKRCRGGMGRKVIKTQAFSTKISLEAGSQHSLDLRKNYTLRLDHKDKETVIQELLSSAVKQCWNLRAHWTPEELLCPPATPRGNRYQRNRIKKSFRQFQMTIRVRAYQQVPLLITIYNEVKGTCPKPNSWLNGRNKT